MHGNEKSQNNLRDINELTALVSRDPDQVLQEFKTLLRYLGAEDNQEQVESSEIIHILSKKRPQEVAEFFEPISRYIRESDGISQLNLIKTVSVINQYVNASTIVRTSQVYIELLISEATDFKIKEHISGVISRIAREDPSAVAPHTDNVVGLLYSNQPSVGVNALHTLEDIAAIDSQKIVPFTTELFEVLEYALVPEENRAAFSILTQVMVDHSGKVDNSSYIRHARALALSNNDFVQMEVTKEIGLLASEKPILGGELLDIIVKHLNSDSDDLRRQAMIECLRLSNHSPQVFEDCDNIDRDYVYNLVTECVSEFNYRDEHKDITELIERVRGMDDA